MYQLDHIQSFAMKLMRQRKALDGVGSGALARGDSFNTEMGMAFSTKNDHEDFTYKDPSLGGA
jgi:hypothetical protein